MKSIFLLAVAHRRLHAGAGKLLTCLGGVVAYIITWKNVKIPSMPSPIREIVFGNCKECS